VEGDARNVGYLADASPPGIVCQVEEPIEGLGAQGNSDDQDLRRLNPRQEGQIVPPAVRGVVRVYEETFPAPCSTTPAT
jgi:hypothetical protein